MADVVSLGTIPSPEDIRSQLLDLQRRLEAGDDVGSRIAQIRSTVATMRACAGGLRRVLDTPDEALAAHPELTAAAEKMWILAEKNVAKVEELLRLVAAQAPWTSLEDPAQHDAC